VKVLRKDCCSTFHGASTAEALPQAAAVKVAMFVNREVKHVDSEPGSLRPVTSLDTDKPLTPYKVSTQELAETSVVTEDHSPIVPLAAARLLRDEGVQPEGFKDNLAEVSDAHLPTVPPVIIEGPPTVPPAVPQSHPSEGVDLEGLGDCTAEVPNAHPPLLPPVVIKDPCTIPSAGPQHRPNEGVKLSFGDKIARVLYLGRPMRLVKRGDDLIFRARSRYDQFKSSVAFRDRRLVEDQMIL